jgi:DNA repair protein RadC
MKISSSRLAYNILRKHMIQDVEELWCLALGPGLKLISIQMIFRGTVDACTVHPRDIFRFACVSNASQLIIAHNHPSGDRTPSRQDLEFTQRLITVGWHIEIPIIDHLILTKSNYLSLAESGELTFLRQTNDLEDCSGQKGLAPL